MTLEPTRRTFSEAPKGRRLRDVDAPGRARRFKVLAWALYAGVPMGAAAGFAAGHPFLGLLICPILIWTAVTVVAEVSGRGGSVLYMPSGSSTPRKKEYSQAKALAARGEFEAAIATFQAAILEDPQDGEAYLNIARIYRDELREPERALTWFRRTLAEASPPEGQGILARREMAELLIHHLEEPTKAAPDLARMAEEYAGRRTGEWAREELTRIKKRMLREL